jgi:hypothetical protein
MVWEGRGEVEVLGQKDGVGLSDAEAEVLGRREGVRLCEPEVEGVVEWESEGEPLEEGEPEAVGEWEVLALALSLTESEPVGVAEAWAVEVALSLLGFISDTLGICVALREMVKGGEWLGKPEAVVVTLPLPLRAPEGVRRREGRDEELVEGEKVTVACVVGVRVALREGEGLWVAETDCVTLPLQEGKGLREGEVEAEVVAVCGSQTLYTPPLRDPT